MKPARFLGVAVALVATLPLLSGHFTGVAQAASPAETTHSSYYALNAATVLTIIPEASEARYRMIARTLMQAPEEKLCTTHAISGGLTLDPDGVPIPEQSRIVVDQRAFQCTSARADALLQKTLETNTYPLAEFVIRDAPGLPSPAPPSDVTPFQLSGDQSAHGVTRATTYAAMAGPAEQGMAMLASAQYKMTDFNMQPPSIGPLLKVDDVLKVELDLKTSIGDVSQ